ncbi:MAG: desulfoferrodoxin [Candidatus Sabulitectum sp.]|nr:desulfoferrodoxin [Candidatus Sabulitectum sp.]
MAERMQVYRCERCGNIVEVLHGGPGQLVCCNVDMELLDEKTADSTTEKHVPVIEKIAGGYKVKVGSVPHPMADAHYIEWIELVADSVVYRKYLNPGDAAEAVFAIDAGNVSAREYCSVHSLWKG